MGLSCAFCHAELDLSLDQKISFQEECTHCSRDLHCCKMCKFYDTNAYNDCREPSADRIVDKEKRNFCDYFILSSPGSESLKAKDAINAAEALFKK